ncbi:MAG TPA: polysaccharide lyase family 7 protein [Burkholderiaceae bacterium]
MSHFKIPLTSILITILAGGAHAQIALDPTAAPGQNFDLSRYRLQTLDGTQRFTEVSVLHAYQDSYFFTDPKSGAMIFRTPAGAGHSRHSEYPRVELREIDDFTMDSSGGRQHAESLAFRVMSEPKTGKLIFAQIHGESAGTELLKLRWTHGDVLMGVKVRPGAAEEQLALMHGLSTGDLVECQIALLGNTVTVRARSNEHELTQSFTYDESAWSGQRLYFKVGNYTQDNERDDSEGVVAVQQLKLAK